MKFLGIVDPFVGTLELLDFLKELTFGFDMCEHFFSDKHFIENETGTPDIALLVIILKFEHFGGSVERSACTFGHLDFYISGQTEIGYLEFFVLVEKDIIRFEISMEFVWIG